MTWGLWVWVLGALSVTASLAAMAFEVVLKDRSRPELARYLPRVEWVGTTVGVLLFLAGLFDLMDEGANEATVWFAFALVLAGGVAVAATAVLVALIPTRPPKSARGVDSSSPSSRDVSL